MERVYVFAPVSGWNDIDWGELVDHTKLNPNERIEPVGFLAGWDYEIAQAEDVSKRLVRADYTFRWFTRPIPSDDRTEIAAHLCMGILMSSLTEARKVPDFAELFMFTGFEKLLPGQTVPRAA